MVRKPLFGDRDRYGRVPDPTDACWKQWTVDYSQVMENNRRFRVSGLVHDSGYKVVRELDLQDRRLLEIGAGEMAHLGMMRSKPVHIDIVDTDRSMLDLAAESLGKSGIPYELHLVEPDGAWPIPPRSVDVVLAFYVFEHIHPLRPALDKILHALKDDGVLAGAIPCEGGMGWGVGRFLTTRRYYRQHADIDFDKVICWEHPNTAAEVLNHLEERFLPRWVRLWPLGTPCLDINLTARFLYEKRAGPRNRI